MEIRRYLTEGGRDVFGEWVANLKNARTRAKIVARIDRLALGNFGDCKALGGGLHELKIDWGRATAFTTLWLAKSVFYCSPAAINAGNHPTLIVRENIWWTTRKGRYETQGKHISR
jgi:hypothetical protein